MNELTDKQIIELRDKHMTYSGVGYIYWKSKSFEHFDEPWEFFQKLSATEPSILKEIRTYVERILHLEELGVKVSTESAVWRWDWYKDMTKDNPYLELIQKIGDIYHKNGKIAFRVNEKNHNVVYVENGEVTGTDMIEYDEGLYHYFTKELGMKALNVGQPKHNGLCYATTKQLLAFFNKNKIPTAI